jgi:YidC/Oxa1 family membrane protein insertase
VVVRLGGFSFGGVFFFFGFFFFFFFFFPPPPPFFFWFFFFFFFCSFLPSVFSTHSLAHSLTHSLTPHPCPCLHRYTYTHHIKPPTSVMNRNMKVSQRRFMSANTALDTTVTTAAGAAAASPTTPSSEIVVPATSEPVLMGTAENILDAVNPDAIEVLGTGFSSLSDCYSPVCYTIYAMEWIHTTTGVPWWGAIIGATLMVRTLLLPVAVYQQRNTAKMTIIRPKIDELNEKQKQMREMGMMTRESIAENRQKMAKLFEDGGVSPWKSFAVPLMQAPIFITYFFAIRRMAANIPSFAEEGTMWFVDLAARDPTWILPITSSALMLLTMELSATLDGNDKRSSMMKNGMRAVSLILIPVTASLPAGVFMYWTSSNLFTLCWTLLCKSNLVRSVFKIPIVKPTAKQQDENLQKIVGASQLFGGDAKEGQKNLEQTFQELFGAGAAGGDATSSSTTPSSTASTTKAVADAQQDSRVKATTVSPDSVSVNRPKRGKKAKSKSKSKSKGKKSK